MAKIFCGVPTYKNDLHADVMFTALQASREHNVMFGKADSSACTMMFNILLLQALEERARGNADYFLLWHSDVVPEPLFVDKMVRIAREKNAEVLSAIIPIKDEKGLTSTALDEVVGDYPALWRVRRLTMREIMQKEPTFTDPKILVNTGLLLIDLKAPWADKFHFHFDDNIIEYHGRRLPAIIPEDWMFSRDIRALGAGPQWVTREVAVRHFGDTAYPNNQVWGTVETDVVAPTPEDIKAAVNEAAKVQGWMSWEELAYLAEKAKSATCVVELGSWKGRSTKAMAMTCKGKIYAVDSWRGSTEGDATGVEAEQRGRETIKGEFYDNVAIEHKNVVVTDCEHAFAGTSLKHLAGTVDFAFVDGDHSFEHVKRDILTCLDLMAPGGILSGHDLNEPGVAKAVNELLPGAKSVGGTSIWEYTVPVVAAVSA